MLQQLAATRQQRGQLPGFQAQNDAHRCRRHPNTRRQLEDACIEMQRSPFVGHGARKATSMPGLDAPCGPAGTLHPKAHQPCE